MRDKEKRAMQIDPPARVRQLRRVLAAAGAAMFALAGSPAIANAEFGVAAFDGAVSSNAAGDAYTQAGGHPFEISTDIAFNTTFDPFLNFSTADGDPKDIVVDLPTGLIGNPAAIPACEPTDFFAADLLENDCPNDTQVGVAVVDVPGFQQWVPLYSLRPAVDSLPAAFGFTVGGVPVILEAKVRSGSDYGITITVPRVNQGISINATRLTLWGVPAAREHDAMRCRVILQRGGSGPYGCWDDASDPRQLPTSVGYAPRAFLSLPTTCTAAGVGLETTLRVNSWQDPGTVHTRSFTSHLPPGYPNDPSLWGPPQGPENCDALPFAPRVTVTPTSTVAGKPTGANVRINVPQAGFESPSGLATAHLRGVSVLLPEGMSINPSGADGLQACTEAQMGYGNDAAPSCPEASKVGTVTIDTPVLRHQLRGDVFIGEPRPGQIFRLTLFAEAPGVAIKLRGEVTPDPRSGQIRTTFTDNPQLPFTDLELQLKSGPRAPLTNPPTCGTYTANSQLTSWSNHVADSSSSFAVTGPNGGACAPLGFTPSFSAGLTNASAGTSSPLAVTFGRDDDDQILKDVTVDLPEGLTGLISSTELCAEAQANAGTCDESTRIGSTTTGAGSGTNPYFLPGRVYITGPYKGAPFGMSIVVPAVAGPFNLGTVVVRAAIHVDRQTASLRVVSDSLPTILEGVPLLLRRVTIAVDKPGFIVPPTSCGKKSVNGRLGSASGTSAAVSARFQLAGCRALDYEPRMTFSIGDRRHVRGGGTAPLNVTLRMPAARNANNQSIEVTLPDNLNSRLAALRGACSLEDAAARRCGAEAVVGRAVAVTPLLRDPVSGPVYIIRTPGNRLPNLWVALRGGAREPVDIDLIGRVRIVGKRLLLRTTFAEIPDVPVTLFRLSFVTGRQAPIGIIRGICSASVRKGMLARLAMRGQNGAFIRRQQRMSVSGCRSARRAAKAKRGSKRRASSKSRK